MNGHASTDFLGSLLFSPDCALQNDKKTGEAISQALVF